jgi:esterase/lipase superfamily enzyme
LAVNNGMDINREYHKWWSVRLNRAMELLVIGHAGAKVLVFPTRGGRFYEYEQMRMPLVLREKIENGHLQFFCVDGIASESYYCWWAHPEGRIQRHIQYEEYILHEVFPFMERKNAHPCVIAHGCSLGAYQAANIAFRHPHLFKKLAAFSGRYDLTLSVRNFQNLFDGYYSEDIYYHTPTHFLPNLNCPKILGELRNLDIVLTVGKEDPFRDNNEQLSGILRSKEINHQIHHWDDLAHSGHYWRKMAQIYV